MATEVPPDSPGLTAFRILRVEKAVEKLDVEKASNADLTELTQEVRGMRRMLMGFMVSIAVATVVFSFTILQLVVQH